MVGATATQDTPFYSPSTALGHNTQEERKLCSMGQLTTAAPAGTLLQGAHLSTAFLGGTTWKPKINSAVTFKDSGASESRMAVWNQHPDLTRFFIRIKPHREVINYREETPTRFPDQHRMPTCGQISFCIHHNLNMINTLKATWYNRNPFPTLDNKISFKNIIIF